MVGQKFGPIHVGLYFLIFIIHCSQQEFSSDLPESGADADEGEGESEAEAEAEAESEGEAEAEPECTNGASRCVVGEEGAFEVCIRERWQRGHCEGGCADGMCEISACPGAETVTTCTDDGWVMQCRPTIGGFTDPAPCPAGESCFDGNCTPWRCVPGTIFCSSETIVALCNDVGSDSSVMKACAADQSCVGTTCIGICDEAEAQHTSVGCVFYPLDTDNLDSPDDAYQYVIYAANADPVETASVTLEVHSAAGWSPYPSAATPPVTVGPGETYAFYATCGESCVYGCQCPSLGPDRHPEGTGLWNNKAFRLTSTRPISAYQLNSDDIGGAATSTGATILLPEGAIDTTYYAVTYPHVGLNSGWVTVVATQDTTSVTVTLASDTAAGTGIAAMSAGDTYETTLDEGEVLQLATASSGDDLTGTKIEASLPVTVFSGHEDAAMRSGSYNDHLEEQLHPVVAWGKDFVASPTPIYPSGSCVGLGSAAESSFGWRIVASMDETTVEFVEDGTLVGVPASPIVLDDGEWTEFWVTGGSLNRGNFSISADHPIEVMEFIGTGPTEMVLQAPVEQFLPRYAFPTTPYFADVLTIVRPTGTTVLLDGFAPSGTWTPVTDTHEVMSVGICTDDVAHTVAGGAGFEGEAFAIYISGNGGVCTYAYLGGLSQERINLPSSVP